MLRNNLFAHLAKYLALTKVITLNDCYPCMDRMLQEIPQIFNIEDFWGFFSPDGALETYFQWRMFLPIYNIVVINQFNSERDKIDQNQIIFVWAKSDALPTELFRFTC